MKRPGSIRRWRGFLVRVSLVPGGGVELNAAMFRAYAIVGSSDQRDAMEMLDRARARRAQADLPAPSPSEDARDLNE